MTKTSSIGYHVYTRKYDCEVAADRLGSALGPLSAPDNAILRQSWADFERELATFWQAWEVNLPKGVDHSDTVVTLLLDQSGSMKGLPMLLAAMAIKAAERLLLEMGCSVEVLGFTTASWRGGRPRRRWKLRLSPKQPGRLCELLHIVYRDAAAGTLEMSKLVFAAMLRPDLPKDNVDGEAILWATDRLRARTESRKILVVLSDGSPVDDSTQSANGPLFLDLHLRDVLAGLATERQIEIAALGIGHDVSGWYPRSEMAKTPADLGSGLIRLLETVLAAPPSNSAQIT